MKTFTTKTVELLNLYNRHCENNPESRLFAMEKQTEDQPNKELTAMHEQYFSKTYKAIALAEDSENNSSFNATVLEKDYVVFPNKTAFFALEMFRQWFEKLEQSTKGAFKFPDLALDIPAFDRVVTKFEYMRAETLSYTPFTAFFIIAAMRLLSFQTARIAHLRGLIDYVETGELKDNLMDLACMVNGGMRKRDIDKLKTSVERKTRIIDELRESNATLNKTNERLITLDGCTDEELEKVKASLRRRGFVLVDTNSSLITQLKNYSAYLANETEWSRLEPGGSENATFADVDEIRQNMVVAAQFAEVTRYEHLVKIEDAQMCRQCNEMPRTHAITPCGCFKFCVECVKVIQPSKRKSRCPSCRAPTTGAMEIKL